jgi:hypothetical protein
MKRKVEVYTAILVAIVVAIISFGANWINFSGSPASLTRVNNKEDSTPSGSQFFISNAQLNGQLLKIGYVNVAFSGFIAVVNNSNGRSQLAGVSSYMTAGSSSDVLVFLNKEVKNADSYSAIFYKDNGDKSFSIESDMPALGESGEVETVPIVNN